MNEIEPWYFGDKRISDIEQDELCDLRCSHKAATNGLLPILREHAKTVLVNDSGGLIIIFDEPLAGKGGLAGEHFGGFRGFLTAENHEQITRMLREVIEKIGRFGDPGDIAKRLETADGNKVVTIGRRR